MPKGPRLVHRKGSRILGNLSKEDIEAIEKENAEMEKMGFGDPEEGAMFTARHEEETNEPPRKRAKITSSAQLITKVVDTLGEFKTIEKVPVLIFFF